MLNTLHAQSPDIARGVDRGSAETQGAGDQGLMFGYACSDTAHLMPAPIDFAHAIMLRAALVRKQRVLPFLGPDGKCQVTVRYGDGRPAAIETVVLSHQHQPDVDPKHLHDGLVEEVIKPALPAAMLGDNVCFLVNPTGRFVVGGPHGDTGLTGRKLIVDTYGGKARHGGGAFSGKDPSKVDRSAAYMARYVAKNIVASGICRECEVQIAYAIGVAEPVSLYVNTFGTGKVPEQRIETVLRRSLRPDPRRHHRRARSRAADLSPDGHLRALREGRVFVGTDRPRRGDRRGVVRQRSAGSQSEQRCRHGRCRSA